MTAVEKAVQKAVQTIKRSPYGGTAIKVELEAQLDRENSSERYETCDYCTGDGYIDCPDCTDGTIDDERDNETECNTCWGSARIDCEECDGRGEIESESGRYWDEDACYEYIHDYVSKGAKDALIYSKFYDDGSVDSEFTFTVDINKPYAVLEFIEAFKSLAQEIGNGMDVDGAGMHIAILNSKSGGYPGGNRLDSRRARNFKRSMTHLLPALYFLASPNHQTRGFGYRCPKIDLDDKYSAITGHQGVFEYRVFDTCYDQPKAFLDFLCVIANSMKFYSLREVKRPFFDKIGDVRLKDNRNIPSMYDNVKLYQALKAGVEVLKPSYKTFDQLKKERGYTHNTKTLRQKEKIALATFRQEWPEAKQRALEQLKKRQEMAKVAYKDHLQYHGEAWMARYYGSQAAFMEFYIKDNFRPLPMTLRDYIAARLASGSSYTVKV